MSHIPNLSGDYNTGLGSESRLVPFKRPFDMEEIDPALVGIQGIWGLSVFFQTDRKGQGYQSRYLGSDAGELLPPFEGGSSLRFLLV